MKKDTRKEGAMTTEQVNRIIRKNAEGGFALSRDELSAKCGITKTAVKHREQNMGFTRPWKMYKERELDIPKTIEEDTKVKRLSEVHRVTKQKYDHVLEENQRLAAERDAALLLRKSVQTHRIVPGKESGGEGTAVVLASDWHVEEEVKLSKVNGLNEYNLDISRKRADHFFQIVLRLVKIEQQDTRIDNVVLALLGDFISGNIHEELLENCLLQPIDATLRAQEYIISGIKFLLDNSKLNITVVCHSGNHGRITKKVHVSTEQGNSLEYMMYRSVALYFQNNPRITFVIPDSYHSYVEVYDKVIRFHHGHAIKFGGGIGGVTIPIRKAIGQWNQMRRADLDCFGHFHQFLDGGSFIVNGSMIGHNAFGINIKAEYQEPIQTFFVLHNTIGKQLGKISVRPIYFERR